MFNNKVLILSPHMDDEVLGCGGLIAQIADKEPALLHIHYFNDFHPLFDARTLRKENEKLISKIGCTKSVSLHKKVNRLDSIPIAEHINEIEGLINTYSPDTLLVTFPSYNQDHRRIFEATITATRPHDKNFFVKNILVYEQPETIQANRIITNFTPHIFQPIDINKKIELYKIYKTQIRKYRTFDHLKYLAGLRGMQCNFPFAESFMVIRITGNYLRAIRG